MPPPGDESTALLDGASVSSLYFDFNCDNRSSPGPESSVSQVTHRHFTCQSFH